MAREAKIIVEIRFDHLEPAGSSVGIVAVKTIYAGPQMFALLKIEPLLVLLLRMGLDRDMMGYWFGSLLLAAPSWLTYVLLFFGVGKLRLQSKLGK